MKILPTSPGAIGRVLLLFVFPALVGWWFMIRMPGQSFHGPAPGLTAEELKLRGELAADVGTLAGEIGERNIPLYPRLQAAADFIDQSFAAAGLQPRRVGYDVEGVRCENIVAEIPGRSPELVIIGAHYDTVAGSPGANDNGSGVAALLALARRAAGKTGARTLRFVAFANEEPGHFQTETMGSWVYAKGCKERGEKISAMISLETIGYFSNEPGTQKYPIGALGALYPTTGNFIAFVGNLSSRALVRRALGSFRNNASLPSEGAALPAGVPGVGWSDHWASGSTVSRDYDHGYRALSLSALPRAQRHAGQARLRFDGSPRARMRERDRRSRGAIGSRRKGVSSTR
ncbi:MAG: M28 family peptidase [Chthoniobacterales bacterium]